MTRIFLLILTLQMATFAISQNLSFRTSEADAQVMIYEKQMEDRAVTITDGKLRVTNFKIDPHKDLIADVKYSEDKEYLDLGLSKWYYCENSNNKDFQYILIVPQSQDATRLVLQELLSNAITAKFDLYID
ncbi:MAG: hypothetical protein KDC53_19660 [Saprospiraceae bacterium]|nr:hypothetical protein [Saprospiraceae bacterium]